MTSDKDHLIKTIAGSLSPARAEVILAGLRGSAPAYVLSRLLQEMAATFLVITADAESAEEVFRELCFYAGEKESILSFPSWDPAPFDPVSPHPEITGRRLNTLFQLTSGNVKAIVAPIAAVIQKVLPKQALGDVSQYLLPGEEAAREELLTKLVRLGYVSTPLVEDPGTFSIRGGILDIFPPNLPLPVRIEFFGDFVDTIRAFDPVTQRSLHALPELILLPRVKSYFPKRMQRLHLPLVSRTVAMPSGCPQPVGANCSKRCTMPCSPPASSTSSRSFTRTCKPFSTISVATPLSR